MLLKISFFSIKILAKKTVLLRSYYFSVCDMHKAEFTTSLVEVGFIAGIFCIPATEVSAQ